MIALEYRLQLLQPLLVPGPIGEPNSAIAYPYVPGSQIRGALIGLYMRSNNLAKDVDLLSNTNTHRLFFSDTVRFLNAYPQDDQGTRMLPTPQSWFTKKRQRDKILDFWLKDESDQEDEKTVVPKFEKVSAEFCTISADNQVRLYHPMRQINVHTQRDPKMGRATSGKGTVFRYDALAANQVFSGVILFDKDADQAQDLKTIRGLLAHGELWLGGSRSAGYGHVCIEQISDSSSWSETKNTQLKDLKACDEFTVTLLSDALVRDPKTGQYSNDLRHALKDIAGQELGIKNRFRDTTLVGGFNRKWGLPLPQAVTLAAGSVFVFILKNEQTISKAALQRLMDQGVGEQRVEGFGRVTVDWHTKTEYPYPKDIDQKSEAPDVTLTGEAQKIAKSMVEQIYRARLDRWLAAKVNQTIIQNRPSNSQLSRFRLVCREALWQSCNLQLLEDHLSDVLTRKAPKEQFRSAHVQTTEIKNTIKRLDDWISGHLENHTTLLEGQMLPKIGDITIDESEQEEWAKKYTIRLIDGVLHKAARLPQSIGKEVSNDGA